MIGAALMTRKRCTLIPPYPSATQHLNVAEQDLLAGLETRERDAVADVCGEIDLVGNGFAIAADGRMQGALTGDRSWLCDGEFGLPIGVNAAAVDVEDHHSKLGENFENGCLALC